MERSLSPPRDNRGGRCQARVSGVSSGRTPVAGYRPEFKDGLGRVLCRDRGDDRGRQQRGDQAVLDGTGARFVAEELA